MHRGPGVRPLPSSRKAPLGVLVVHHKYVA
jgi:hypothetical protein